MIPFLTDRTTIETDWTCAKKRWWYKHAEGKGIVPSKEQAFFLYGRLIHHDMSRLIQGEDILPELWAGLPHPQEGSSVLEPAWRRIGWAIAAQKWLIPRLLQGKKVEMVEKELVLEAGPLWIASTADLVLRTAQDELEVIDYKTVGYAGPEWQTHWPYAIQMHLQIKSVEKETGLKVNHAKVIGLQKGQEKYGRLYHPSVWAYQDSGGNLKSEWKNGYAASPLWDHLNNLDDLTSYIVGLGEDIGMAQFPSSHPIFFNDRLVSQLIEERTARETILREGLEDGWPEAILFPSNFKQCRPEFGRNSTCPYLAACHNAQVNSDPLGSGLYVARTPHHDIELLDLEVTDEDS